MNWLMKKKKRDLYERERRLSRVIITLSCGAEGCGFEPILDYQMKISFVQPVGGLRHERRE